MGRIKCRLLATWHRHSHFVGSRSS
jgi:hypothetical protein